MVAADEKLLLSNEIELLVKALDTNWLKLLKEKTVEDGGCGASGRLVLALCRCSMRIAEICTDIFFMWSHAFLPVLVFRVWWCSTNAPIRGQMSSSKNMSIEIHIPYGGIQKRKTETVHKTELQDKRGPTGEKKKQKTKKQRGMEDGLICEEEEEN